MLLGLMMGVYKQQYSVSGNAATHSLARNFAILAVQVAVMGALLAWSRPHLLLGSYRATLFVLATGCALAPATAAWAQVLSSSCILWSQFMLLGLVWTLAPRIAVGPAKRRAHLVGWCFAAFYTCSALGSLGCGPIAAGLGRLLATPHAVAVGLLLCVLAAHFFMVREQDIRYLVDQKERDYRQGRAALLSGCQAVARASGLSERELDVLTHWLLGETAAEIAAALCVSENTVRTHVRHIYGKTGAHDRAELLELVRLA